MAVKLTEHQEGQCRAVIDGKTDDRGIAYYCGEVVTLKLDGTRSSWCEHHHERFTYVHGTRPPVTSGERVFIKRTKLQLPTSNSPWFGPQRRAAAKSESEPKPGMILLTEARARYFRNVPMQTIHSWGKKGHLPVVKIAGRTFVSIADAEAFKRPKVGGKPKVTTSSSVAA